MHKVMTRAQRLAGTHPPSRRDLRRPGGTPPRTPGAGAARTTSGDGRPPGAPRGTAPRTRPTDTRPPTAPTRTTARPAISPSPAAPDRTAPIGPSGTAPGGPDRTTPASPAQPPRRSIPHPLPTDVFAELLLAVLSGQRPVHAMLRHTAARAYDELAWLAERSPLRARGTRPVVRDIGYFEPRPGAIEAFARIGAGDQLRAMAFRLEQGRDLRWRCTAVELGGPRMRRAAGD
ncbi:Rv3235 family protein [Streptomyces deserti]